MALLDAWALARALAKEGSLDEWLAHAVSMRRFHVGLYQRLTALFTPLYQSDRLLPAVLRDAFFAPLGRIGPGPRIQAALVGGLVGNPLRKLGLAMPNYGAFARPA
jgi:2-polyprenyl-6-methoxyphenol hydroxylase-like FAD-dependent oxidoreductase